MKVKSIAAHLPVSLLLLCAGAACSEEKEAKVVTYTQHIRPLLASHCTSCHEAGGVAPFVLDSYDAAKERAAGMATEVASRRMPPHPADGSGACESLLDPLWLSAEQIRLFERFADEGRNEGDTSIAAPEQRARPALSGEVRTVDIGGDYRPDPLLDDDYRCFVVDSPGTADFALQGFNVRPGNTALVHHLLLYQAADRAAGEAAEALASAAVGLGYPCLGTGAQVDVSSLAAWTPGQGAVVYPSGTGFPVAGDRPLIVEIHYNLAGDRGASDRTVIDLQVTGVDNVLPIYEVPVADFTFAAPPGDASFITQETWQPLTTIDAGLVGYFLVLGATAHMHKLGVAQKLERIAPNGDASCLLDVPVWDFDWQLSYWYSDPPLIGPGDGLRITCEFNTSTESEAVVWGDGTRDEMCLGSVFLIPVL